ncbi:hypothetical protein H2203_002445 [Taxawa tesnikishii (nom. ined.)]|nr:hypothetical protein H2203_002445 [Dothideales sp. JES 119]
MANLSFATSDTVMDVDNATKKDAARPMSNNAAKKAKQDKKDRIAKKRHRKPTNSMTFKNKVGKKRK